MFSYDPAILERFPDAHAGIVHAIELTNHPSPPGLIEGYRAEQAAVADRLQTVNLADLPSIAAWRRVFTRFGAKPTQYRSAAEALLRRLSKRGDIPSIGTLVDIGNMVSIRHALPVAVVDTDGIAGAITVVLATGSEPFTDLGASQAVNPDEGEVVFVDEEGVACSRRWCWRQSAQSATSHDTVSALFVTEGHHSGVRADIESAVKDIKTLLAAHQPQARVDSFLLFPD